MLAIVLLPPLVFSQSKYRTFTQDQLSQREDLRAGRGVASNVSFVVKNTFSEPKNVISAHVSSRIIALTDSGGFPIVRLMNYNTTIVAEGKVLQPGDSVIFSAVVARQVSGTKITGYQMRMKTLPPTGVTKTRIPQGNLVGASVTTMTITHGLPSRAIKASSDVRVIAQPTGGNVLGYLYRQELRKPAGIVLGVARGEGGWIRSYRSDIQTFPHFGFPRCLDSFYMSTRLKPFKGELKNPRVRVHNNRLVGNLLALKLSILANDSSVTEPFDPDATPLRLLLYNDSANVNDPFNNFTVQQICNAADTALTYCTRFSIDDYRALDTTIARILNAFAGQIAVTSMRPMKIPGVSTLAEVPFLHENPTALAGIPRRQSSSDLETVPLQNTLAANYPNPFNPTTTLSFSLKELSFVTLKVYNILGQEVASLLDRTELDAGEHAIDFDANNLSSGTYYYRINITDVDNNPVYADVKKMMLVR